MGQADKPAASTVDEPAASMIDKPAMVDTVEQSVEETASGSSSQKSVASNVTHTRELSHIIGHCDCTGSCNAPSCSCDCSNIPSPSCSTSTSSSNKNQLCTPAVELGFAIKLEITNGVVSVRVRSYAKMDEFGGKPMIVDALGRWTSNSKIGTVSLLDVKQDWATLMTVDSPGRLLSDVGFCDIAPVLCDAELNMGGLDLPQPDFASLFPGGLSRGFVAPSVKVCTPDPPGLDLFPGASLPEACTSPSMADRTTTIQLSSSHLPEISVVPSRRRALLPEEQSHRRLSTIQKKISDAFSWFPTFDMGHTHIPHTHHPHVPHVHFPHHVHAPQQHIHVPGVVDTNTPTAQESYDATIGELVEAGKKSVVSSQ